MNEPAIFGDTVAAVFEWIGKCLPNLTLRSDPDLTITKKPVAVIRRTGGVARTKVTDEAFVSIDIWCPDTRTGIEDAHDVAQAVRAQLKRMPTRRVAGLVVYKVSELSGLARVSDPAFNRDRWSITYAITTRGSALPNP